MQVRIDRDRAFWAALVPHLEAFWFRHILPAREALAQHLEQQRLAGISSALELTAAGETVEADVTLAEEGEEALEEGGAAGDKGKSKREARVRLKAVVK